MQRDVRGLARALAGGSRGNGCKTSWREQCREWVHAVSDGHHSSRYCVCDMHLLATTGEDGVGGGPSIAAAAQGEPSPTIFTANFHPQLLLATAIALHCRSMAPRLVGTRPLARSFCRTVAARAGDATGTPDEQNVKNVADMVRQEMKVLDDALTASYGGHSDESATEVSVQMFATWAAAAFHRTMWCSQVWLRSYHKHKESGLLLAAANRACKSEEAQADPGTHARTVFFTSQVT